MSDTSFVNGVTVSDGAGWAQDVNNALYRGIGLAGVTTIASATTPDIFAVTTSGVISYTGTATCTGFAAATQAGARRTLVCTGAAVFTAGANMLIQGVASGANFTAAAGDIIVVHAITTTQFRLVIHKTDGGAIVGQIKFPATQNASSDANTLDGYEEGTWTPTDTSGAGLSITNNGSSYTIIGRLVHIQFDLSYPATADGSNAAIGTLPASPVGVSALSVGSTSNGSALNITINNGSTSLQFRTAASGTIRTNANLTTNGIAGGGTYQRAT